MYSHKRFHPNSSYMIEQRDKSQSIDFKYLRLSISEQQQKIVHTLMLILPMKYVKKNILSGKFLSWLLVSTNLIKKNLRSKSYPNKLLMLRICSFGSSIERTPDNNIKTTQENSAEKFSFENSSSVKNDVCCCFDINCTCVSSNIIILLFMEIDRLLA